MSFGAQSQLLHPFGKPFTPQAGADVLRQFTFAQQHSHIGELMRTANALFRDARSRSSQSSAPAVSQLLFIVSDTDQIHQEGTQLVERWIREVTDSGVFPVFVIIDSPTKEHSILDQLACTFHDGEMQMDRYVIAFCSDVACSHGLFCTVASRCSHCFFYLPDLILKVHGSIYRQALYCPARYCRSAGTTVRCASTMVSAPCCCVCV